MARAPSPQIDGTMVPVLSMYQCTLSYLCKYCCTMVIYGGYLLWPCIVPQIGCIQAVVSHGVKSSVSRAESVSAVK
jgi:hypothetical protein